MKQKSIPLKFSQYQIIAIVILALTQFSVVLDFMVMSPLGDLIMKNMKISPNEFGLVVSCYAFSAGISGFFTASIADKFDRKKLLLIFYAGFILGTLLCGLATSYWLLVSARIVTGIFGGVISSISLAIVADIRPEFAILAGALVAPIAKALDPKSGKEADYGINAK